MWKTIGLVALAIGWLAILFKAENTEALKCYHCHMNNQKNPCPNEGRGELITCVNAKDTTCWKLVAISNKTALNYSNPAQIGESREKGCGQPGAWAISFNKSLHPGCQPHNANRHYCSCDTDRCNDEGKMTEYLTES